MIFGIILQNSNGMMIFGKIDENLAIFILAVLLIVVTIGIRWLLKRYDNKTNSKSGDNEVLR